MLLLLGYKITQVSEAKKVQAIEENDSSLERINVVSHGLLHIQAELGSVPDKSKSWVIGMVHGESHILQCEEFVEDATIRLVTLVRGVVEGAVVTDAGSVITIEVCVIAGKFNTEIFDLVKASVELGGRKTG